MKRDLKSDLKLLKRRVECEQCWGDGFDVCFDEEDEWIETCPLCNGTGVVYDDF